MTAAETKVMEDLQERMDALELEVARMKRKNGANGAQTNGGGRPERKPNGKPRWLESARFANACQGSCGGRVEQGERAYYVPGVGVYHATCAPAEASR